MFILLGLVRLDLSIGGGLDGDLSIGGGLDGDGVEVVGVVSCEMEISTHLRPTLPFRPLL